MTDTGVPFGTGSRASHEAASASSPKASIPNANQLTISGFIRAMRLRFEDRAKLSPDQSLFATVATLDGWECAFSEPVELTEEYARAIVDSELDYWETTA